MIQAKVVLLGEVSVGKTSLIRRFVDRSFSDTYLCTVGVKISRKRLPLPPGEGRPGADVLLVLWDLEGGTGFSGITQTYLRGARAAVIVGDCTQPGTLDAIAHHAERFRTANPDGSIVVALNKIDLLGDAAVALPSPPGGVGRSSVTYTSARTGEGVDGLFQAVGSFLLQGAENGPAR
jgi:small GTP-binding protein